MFENLLQICQNDANLNNIKNSSTFYFKRGQDALNQWLEMELSEEQKSSMILLSTDYNEFAKISITNTQLYPIQQLLYLITSYCDEKAKDKNIYNEYEDKRILARAGVRMGSWIKSLIEYKFNRQSVIGSTKNAFDYLLDPTNNSTILSENHREYIITHYLNKNYQPELFVTDLKTIFQEYNLPVGNENNYTHYISSLMYSYTDEWRPKRSMSFKQLIEQLTTHFIENNINFNILKLGERAKFVWIGDKDDIIGNAIAHYEVSTRGIKGNINEIFVDVHFEDKNKVNREIFYNTIQNLPENLEWIDWYKAKSIGYKESYNLDNDDNILENITSALEYIDNNIGDTLRKIISSVSNANEINVKEEFTNWLLKKPSANYFYNVKERIIQELDKCNTFFETDIFNVSSSNYKSIISLLNKEMYIESDNDFLKYSEKIQNHLPRAILGKKNYFEFLNEKFSSQNTVNYWLFQGNPKLYDIVCALQENVLTTWKVAAHKDNIKIGDKVILWQSGDNAGCYALAKVTSEVGKIEMNPNEIQYYKTEYGENEDRVSIEIEHNLADDPILWEEIKELPELAELKVGNQGTNFTATEKEYNTIKNMISSDYDNFEKVLKKFNQDELKKYFTQLFEILDTANLEKGDSRMLFSYNNRKLSFSVGQRIALIIRNKSARGKFLILTKGKLNENSSPFGATPPVLYNSNIDTLDLNYNEKQSVFEGVAYELNRVKSSGYRSRNYNDFENAVFDILFRARFQQQNNKLMKNEPNLNQILFGPPGTGKTYNTINEALKIVDPIYFEANQKNRKKLTDRFKELLIKNTDEYKGQIAFCTFHQSFSYEDFVEGIKPKTSDTKSVYYDVEPGIFKRICQLADSYNSTLKVKTEGKLSWSDEQFRKASFYKLSLGAFYNPSDKPIYEYCRDNSYIAIGFGQENDFTGLSESQIVEKCDELDLEVTAAQQMNYFIHYLKKGNYVIIGNGNKYVRAIGKVVGDYEYVAESTIQYNHFRKVEWLFVDENIPIEEIYERGLSQKTMYKIDETALKQDFFTNNGQKEFIDEPLIDEKKYVLVIDEINIGNVSSIFGELITLIEKDKRAGCDEELEVTLPYSKEPFKVPNNVYLIGTMNTADRSIEALDTALRRRFSFTEKPPKPELIKTEGLSGELKGIVKVIANGVEKDIDLESLLIKINNRLEKLIDKDHKIGHSYLLKVNSEETLKASFRNEIIPLLEEYFFGDYGKIGLVLGNTFVELINHAFDFASFDEYDTDIQSDLKEKKVFRIAAETNWDFSKI